MVVYIDDILIYSKNAEEHKKHLQIVLNLLRQHKHFAKLSKSELNKPELEFLGHIVSYEGLRVDPKKIKVVQDWPIPQNVSELRSFLGLANYFRKFIQGVSSLVTPLVQLTKSSSPYSWGVKQENAFREVKQALTSAPVLKLPDPSLP